MTQLREKFTQAWLCRHPLQRDEQLWRSNTRRQRYYTPGLRVLKNLHKPTKLGKRVSGPYNITQVHANRTITKLLKLGVTERINIRRASPYQP